MTTHTIIHAWHKHDHEHGHHHEPLPENQREVTAILLLTASSARRPPELSAMDLVKKINKGNVAQAVLPIREIVTLVRAVRGADRNGCCWR